MTESIEWAEKYRPRTLQAIVGNKKAVQDFRTWAETWASGKLPEKKAVILHGPAGVGKTSSAHALALDLDWEAIELNASDQRTAKVIEKIAGSAASMNSLYGNRRLIILDEADNLHGNSDRGGMRAISGIIRTTAQPIVLIANDSYGLSPTLRNLCLEIKFNSVQSRSIVPALRQICAAEAICCSSDALLKLAENAGGDLRSAINDLQAAASGKKLLEASDILTAERDVKENIFKALKMIFKSKDPKQALKAAYGLDESPEELVQWIDENLPQQYAGEDLDDIRTGYAYLAKADRFLGRVRKRQNYGMWRYANVLMVRGIVAAKSRPYRGFIKFQPPSLWRRRGQTRANRNRRDNLAIKIGAHCFESLHSSRAELLDVYSKMAKNEAYAVDITAGLGLEPEELMYLTGSKKLSNKLQKVYDSAQELRSLQERYGEIKVFSTSEYARKDFIGRKSPEKQKTLENLATLTGKSPLQPPISALEVIKKERLEKRVSEKQESENSQNSFDSALGAQKVSGAQKALKDEDSVETSEKKKSEKPEKSQMTLSDF